MSKNLVKNLDEAMSADFGDDYAAKQEGISKAKRDLFDAMHPSQQEALKEAYNAIAEVTNAYRELYHPSYDDIVKLDSAFWSMRSAFNMD